MKKILTDLTPKEYFKNGGSLEVIGDNTISSYKEFKKWLKKLPANKVWHQEVINIGSIDNCKYTYDSLLDRFNILCTFDPIGIQNICFSLDTDNQKIYHEQRLERGFDSTELWNLDRTFARWFVPRLQVFIQETQGYPAQLREAEWQDILEQMLEGFKLIVDRDVLIYSEEENKKIKKSLDLFSEYLLDLWW